MSWFSTASPDQILVNTPELLRYVLCISSLVDCAYTSAKFKLPDPFLRWVQTKANNVSEHFEGVPCVLRYAYSVNSEFRKITGKKLSNKYLKVAMILRFKS
jgi:hypothetical protein